MKQKLFLNFKKITIFLKVFLFLVYTNISIAKVEERTLQIQSTQNDFKEITTLAEKEILDQLVLELLNLDKSSLELQRVKDKISSKVKKFILLTKIIQTEEISKSSDKKKSKNKKDKKIPLSKQKKDQPSPSELQFTSEVLVRFSTDTLKKILIEENLFYKDKGFNRVLVLIELKDQVNKEVYRWWEKDQKPLSDSPLAKVAHSFYSQLQSVLLKHGFYSVHPILSDYKKLIPDRMSYKSLNKRTAKTLAEFFDAHLMIIGSVTLDQLTLVNMYEAVWDLSLYNTTHLRKLEVHKFKTKVKQSDWEFLTAPHYIYWAKNFAMELNSIYQTGTLSAQLFTVTLEGKLSFIERKEIKKTFVEKIKYIKNLTETVIDDKKIQYSADIEGDYDQLLQAIKNLKVLNFQLSPSMESDQDIVVQVKKL